MFAFLALILALLSVLAMLLGLIRPSLVCHFSGG